jgi:hypothetical protein
MGDDCAGCTIGEWNALLRVGGRVVVEGSVVVAAKGREGGVDLL